MCPLDRNLAGTIDARFYGRFYPSFVATVLAVGAQRFSPSTVGDYWVLNHIGTSREPPVTVISIGMN